MSVFVVGTRAQLIKAAPVIVACEQILHPALLLLTGQHKETMQDLIEEFGIKSPQVNAIKMGERATVLSLIGWIPRAYLAVSRHLRQLKSTGVDINVVVHGDTLSTLLGALAAKHRAVQVFHLESGLTSGKLFDPFPEEISRRIVFRLADVAVCPSDSSSAFMASRYPCRVLNSKENTIIDAVLIASRERTSRPPLPQSTRPYVVASLHRFQNIFNRKRLRYLTEILIQLATQYRIHFVLHPATRKRLQSDGLLEHLSSIPDLNLAPRLGYREFLGLASGAAFVLTDGGSNQEELAVLGVPTIVMRKRTERPDGLGENVVMESDLTEDFASYCLTGKVEALRRPSRLKEEIGPSMLVAEALSRS